MFNKSNMNKMLKQAQAMQSKMADVQEELSDVIIEESTGDIVTVKMNGKTEVVDVKLTDDALNEDKDVLEDVLVTTFNKALQHAQKEAQARMNDVTGNMLGGMKISGM